MTDDDPQWILRARAILEELDRVLCNEPAMGSPGALEPVLVPFAGRPDALTFLRTVPTRNEPCGDGTARRCLLRRAPRGHSRVSSWHQQSRSAELPYIAAELAFAETRHKRPSRFTVFDSANTVVVDEPMLAAEAMLAADGRDA